MVWRFRRVLFLAGLLFVFALAGVGFILANVPLPDVEIPVETTFLLDASGNKLAELSAGENRVSVSLEQISPNLVNAVLAAEDRDFFVHPGIDMSAIARATWADVRGRPLQGGSTITQQYVKYTYVGSERSIVRKVKEATLAIRLERELDKEQILERYLNAIYFGRGAYGAQAASRSYFGKDVSALDIPEAAYLAGLIRAPEAADASRDTVTAGRRRSSVLAAMEVQGHVTAEQRRAMEAVPVAEMEGFRPRDDVVRDRIEGGDVGTQHFVDYVRSQLLERYGDTRLYGGGLRVRTTLNPKLQQAAYQAVYGTLDREDDPAGALVAIDAAGHVKAMVGGRSMQSDAEQSPYAKVNFATGVEGGGSGRQPGSAFKPFVLAEAVSEGYSVESAFDSPSQVVFPGANAGKDYIVRNYDEAAHGRQNLIEATRVSSNTVYAQLAEQLGTAEVADTAERLGIRSPIPTDQLSVALGSVEVSVLDMADAYLTFATRGVQVDPMVITEVTDAEGRVLDEFTAERQRVLEPEQADVVNEVLQEVVSSGTGTGASIGRPLAGKTGTTQGNGDAWFAGYTPGLATAVWMGYPEGQAREMSNVHGVEVTGGTFPADMFRRFMSDALEIDGETYGGDFVAPVDLGGKVFSGGRRSATEPDESTTSSSTTLVEAPASSTTTSVLPSSTTSTTALDAEPTRPASPGMTLRPPPTSTTVANRAANGDGDGDGSSEERDNDGGSSGRNERRGEQALGEDSGPSR
ncbi:MAG: transglycosylase domain-containing protein [Actinobacteria bacterium]|nr:transglycosylase domain-containing protein [Actinomycetota bacterium]